MPLDDAKRFLAWAPTRRALSGELAALRGRDALAQLCLIAAAHGYHFDEAEYRAAVLDESGGELSDDAIAETQREMGIANRD